MRWIGRVIVGFLIFILLVNTVVALLVFWRVDPVWGWFHDGVLVGVGPVAFVFAHGMYALTGPGQHEHVMKMRGSWVKTKDYVAYLHSQGYGLVWGSWCDQGDSPYILMNATSNVSWPSFVDRASFSGGVIPLYAGVWFVRVPYG